MTLIMKRRIGEVRPCFALDPVTQTSYNVLGQNRLACPLDLIPKGYQQTTVIHALEPVFVETSMGAQQIPLYEWYERRPLQSVIRRAERISLVPFYERDGGCVEALATGSHLTALFDFQHAAIADRENFLHVEVLLDQFPGWRKKLRQFAAPGLAIHVFAGNGEFELVP